MTRSSYQATSHGEERSTGQRVVGVVVHGGPPGPAGAGDGDDLAGVQVDAAQQVVDGVGDHHVVAGDLAPSAPAAGTGPAARRTRASLGPAVGAAALAGADPPDDRLAVRRRARRRCGGPSRTTSRVPSGSDDRLAGEAQRRSRARRGGTYGPSPRCRVPFASWVAISSSSSRASPSAWPSPAIDATTYPSGSTTVSVGQALAAYWSHVMQLGVVEHRVGDAVPLDRGRQRVRVALVLELRRVHADDDEHVAVLLLQRPQLVEHVQAVDAAEGPEVEQDDLAAEVAERQLACRRCSASPARAAPAPARAQSWPQSCPTRGAVRPRRPGASDSSMRPARLDPGSAEGGAILAALRPGRKSRMSLRARGGWRGRAAVVCLSGRRVARPPRRCRPSAGRPRARCRRAPRPGR